MNNLYHPSRIRGFIAAALIGTFASNFAAAATPDVGSAPAITVKYSDLNLASSQGAAALYSRIQAAADSVCSPLDGRDLASIARRDACAHKAIVDAVRAVNLPTLFAVYNAKHPAATSNTLVSMRTR